jgi:hypothetical protein
MAILAELTALTADGKLAGNGLTPHSPRLTEQIALCVNASCEFHPPYGQADVDAAGGSVPIRKTIDRLFRFRHVPSDQERSKGLDDRNAIKNLSFDIGFRRTLFGVRPIRRALR